MSKCPICQVILRELCINERKQTLCKVYEDYELGNVKGVEALDFALAEAGYDGYMRAKNSIKKKGLLPKELLGD
ncbi:hypothetical protein BX659_13635 [Orenia metallireducens]|uniref:Uncharacterized protein n=2 Tax=Orenia TaxID=46468 RepID=A0A285IFS2_9FIRM|nr:MULTISPECIES: hypothetical protein [Orenia]PRX20156.1 hypothetical protein BX659_13635 [Orenia metallireducens]TDX48837.1 hypothetical protein C7959_12516 [Orenia marismortui]SNY45791.1 hypothetical protein SAMN06265827_13935 [Orenia metallireducens]